VRPDGDNGGRPYAENCGAVFAGRGGCASGLCLLSCDGKRAEDIIVHVTGCLYEGEKEARPFFIQIGYFEKQTPPNNFYSISIY